MPGSFLKEKKDVSLASPFCIVQKERLPKKRAGRKSDRALRTRGLNI